MSRMGMVVVLMLVLPIAGHADTGVRLEPLKPAASRRVVTPDLQVRSKSEAVLPGLRPAVPSTEPPMRKGAIRHPHRTKLASLAVRDHAKLDEIARSWKSNSSWDAISIQGKGAEQVRTYLVQHGVLADFAVASEDATRASIDLTVTTCDDETIACRRHP